LPWPPLSSEQAAGTTSFEFVLAIEAGGVTVLYLRGIEPAP